MAHRRGRKAEPRETPAATAGIGSLAGFLLLAGTGVALLAGVVLVPAYARLAAAQHTRDRLRAAAGDLEARLAAEDRLIADRDDPVLWQRLAWCQMGVAPPRVVVAMDPDAPPQLPPGVIRAAEHPRPNPPPEWLVRAAANLGRPATRRGVTLLAAATLLLAVLLFPPPAEARKARGAAARPAARRRSARRQATTAGPLVGGA
jgi:hypothetical protein